MSPMLSSAVGEVACEAEMATCSMVVVLRDRQSGAGVSHVAHAAMWQMQRAADARMHACWQKERMRAPVVAQAQVGDEQQALRVCLACRRAQQHFRGLSL